MIYLKITPLNEYDAKVIDITKNQTKPAIAVTNPDDLIETLKATNQNTVYIGVLNIHSEKPELINQLIDNNYNIAIDKLANYHGFKKHFKENQSIHSKIQFLNEHDAGLLEITPVNQYIPKLIELSL